jgi:simple sugar transport system permease protein
MLRLVPRSEPSRGLTLAAPFVALALTILFGALLFVALGHPPAQVLSLFFVEPLRGADAWSELAVKATPLALVAVGLAICFRANVWNIGAEGQFIAGALGATAVAMRAHADMNGVPGTTALIVPAIALAGIAAGGAWAAVVAFLRDRFHANEILVSLMLVYVADMLLGYLTYGPWKDPDGYNFPQTITFLPVTQVPLVAEGHRAHVGLFVALLVALGAWLFLFRTYAGFQLAVGGQAPRAARYAGFSARRSLWTALLCSGGLAGLAGALEVTGPLGQLTPHLPVGYGFTGIIVAFVGRLHPFGILLSSILMSMLYIGGELAQSRLGLPQALSGVFQGLLLFTLLACDALASYRVLRVAPHSGKATAAPAVAG